MVWPSLVPKWARKTPITVYLTDGNMEDGAPNIVKTVEARCSFSESGRAVLDAEKHFVRFAAVALLDGDIAPEREQIEGEVCIAGGSIRRSISAAERARNPDGTVNFTKLELM